MGNKFSGIGNKKKKKKGKIATRGARYYMPRKDIVISVVKIIVFKKKKNTHETKREKVYLT